MTKDIQMILFIVELFGNVKRFNNNTTLLTSP